MSPRSHPGRDQATLLAALSAGATPSRGVSRASQAGAAARRGLLYWTPVLVALGVFAQVSLLGLRPALGESARLARAEEELLGRHEHEQERARQVDRILRAQRDPIYLERERRMLLDPAGGLLAR